MRLTIFPILALDVGEKRVGTAYMSRLSGAAESKSILTRASDEALNRILNILSENKIKTLIAGLPLGQHLQATAQCKDIKNFCRRIERRFDIQTVYIDEYLSSVEATQKVRKKTQKIDDLAAEIILKRFLVAKGLLPDFV